jgi:hypothetical protein
VKHHHYTHTSVEHHDDGSHTVTHHHKDGKSHKKYAKHDHDGMMDGMMQHLSQPNPGEAAADAGDHGVPADAASAAGLPPAAAAAPPAAPGM